MDGVLYLDCSSGVSGDMIVAALAGLGGEGARRHALAALAAAGIDPAVARFEEVRRGGLAALAFAVEERSGFETFAALVDAVQSSSLPVRVQRRVVSIAGRMQRAEREAHGAAGESEEPHLHELAGVDTAVDLICTATLLELLAPAAVIASPPAIGGGAVATAHGVVEVPAPAVVALLRGLPTGGGTEASRGELTTPTGAAILAEVVSTFASLPAGRLLASACGAGSREISGRPNVLRAFFVETGASITDWMDAEHAQELRGGVEGDRARPTDEGVELLEATIDDATPELLGHAAEGLREAGALDVWFTPALMKKGRPGQVLHVLVRASERSRLAEVVFRETTTFGLRVLPVERVLLEERREAVEVADASIRVRLGFLSGRLVTASPEFEDCRRAAAATGVPAAEVYAAAQAAGYRCFGAA